MRLSYSVFFLSVLTACIDTTPHVDSSYFDTKAYFEHEANRLIEQHVLLKKNMTFDGQTDIQQRDTISWTKELRPFIDIDLRKPSYAKRLERDSLRIDEHHYQLIYTSNDKKTDLKKAILEFEDTDTIPQSMKVIITEKNTLYESEKTLTWYHDSAFYIEGHQEVNLTHPIKYRLQGTLIKP
jgi:hypothetical protein